MAGSCAMLRGPEEEVMADDTKRAAPIQEKESVLIRSALAVLLERMGGQMEYTQSEYSAVRAARGEYLITGEVDRSGDGEPVIRVRLVESNAKGSMPVS
jgi:hypothetical protein